MILSVSRRSDIPAFYSKWFFKRLEEGYLYVRNPVNPKAISKIILNESNIDFIVFWTKNPKPIINKLHKLNKYNYYFQFTLTPYGKDIEKGLPPKKELINTFIELSKFIGKEKIVWRYDPILLSSKIDISYHKKCFSKMAQILGPYTEKCIISFIDVYPKIKRICTQKGIRSLNTKETDEILKYIKIEGEKYGIIVESCGENISLEKYGLKHGKCIDDKLIKRITNKKVEVKKDSYQRKDCNCVHSTDIGQYNSCQYECIYCYANNKSKEKHNPLSPLLIGEVEGDEIIKELKRKSIFNKKGAFQIKLF